ncbi:hypothetical protein WN51_04788, partial [Melipona quadrifasciata]
MSSSGYRGRSFGPRGARTNGPANGFNGPRFPHPTFNHPRPPHRLSGPNFVPWQQNKNFHPQYRGNLQYHPNSRGRAAGGRGIVRFSGRPPLAQFRMGFIRTVHTASLLPHKEQVEDESVLTLQTPLLGSEEERQQKIAETADKLKKKLSSITEEELTNFWEDDLSVLPNNEEDIPNKGIPELRHEPPELNLTFTDFKDIGRIDCNNLKCGNLGSKLSNEISISFDKKPKDNIHHELPDLECNVENLQLQSNNITGNLTSSNVDEKLSTLNVDENITNFSPTESVDNSLLEKKMTLYQMLTSDNNLQQSNVEDKEIESPVIRPRTPSLMSQLLQNIDTAPATKTAYERENLHVEDSLVSLNKSKTLGKHNNHHVERKESCVSIYDSENEETDGKSSRKRKRQKSERSVKRFDVDGKKQIDNNAIKVTSKRDSNVKRAAAIEQSSLFPDQILTSETMKLQKDVGKDPSKSQVENEKEEIVPEFDGENCTELARSGEEKNETSSRESNDADSTEKLSESKTPERLSIYSDDSTWDSFLQNSGADDQKKPSTGLALLEETYRKEMAKARQMREKMQKKKKKKLGNMLRTVNALTSDEEELPLATLYAKKLHRRRGLLDLFEQRAKQQSSDCTSTVQTNDPQLWKNVVEVINAVAENRMGDLYVEEPSTEKILTNTETTEAIVLNSRENVEFKNSEEKQVAGSSALKAIEESSTEVIKISENDSKKDDPQMILSNKSQELPNSEHFQQDLDISVKDLPEISTDEAGLVEFSVQQTVASDSVEINRTTEGLDSCNAESNSNNIPDDRNNISNVSEHPKKLEEKTNVETKKSNFKKDKRIDVDESIVAQDPVDRQFVTKPKETKKCSDIPVESDSDKNVAVADEITSKNKPDDSELENVSESKDPLSLHNKDNAIEEVKYSKNSAIKESNCVPQDKQYFVSLKEHKEPRKRKDTERFDKTLSEENNNQSSSFIESTEMLKEDEVFLGKKLLKRKRGSSKTPVRRSSRYIEEPAKRIKVEADTAVPIAKPDEKNFRTQFPCALSTSSLSCEELESILVNPKKCRCVQKPTTNRKRCTPTLSEIEAAPYELSSELSKGIKRHRKHTMFEMMNCMVRLVNC